MEPIKLQVILKTVKRICSDRYDQQSSNLALSGHYNAWRQVLQYGDWSSLIRLNIGYCCLTDAHLKFFKNFHLPQLKSIELFYNKITEEGINTLVQYDWPKLQQMGLTNNKIKNEGLKILMNKLGHQLKQLRLCSCDITAAGIKQIHHLKKISILSLKNNKIRSQGIKLLVKIQMPQLQMLSVSQCQIGDQGAIHLSKSRWPNIKGVWIHDNGIRSIGYQHLFRNCWKEISQLLLKQTNAILLMNSVYSQTKMCYISKKLKNKILDSRIESIFEGRIHQDEDEL